MENKITLTQEEINELKQIQTEIKTYLDDLGQIEYQLYVLNNTKKNIQQQVDLLYDKQDNLSKTLSEKYGDGSVNLETGELTPIL